MAEYVEVTTAAGTVRGRWRNDSAAFLGIPFAESPVGGLRFEAPVPHVGWTGVRDALEYGPTPQRTMSTELTIIPEPSVPGESTLNLNVFTPNPSRAHGDGLPVLVWIHGGGYVAGSPASPWYDGAGFNRDGVVTVTVSYRLGFDGFGWMQDAPLNRGVLDWVLALEWVRDNIAAFGGDPARVTVGGQSAGGGAAMTLLTVPRAEGLFQRCISLSGVPTHRTLEQAEEVGRRLAGLGGVEATRAGLAELSEERILELQARLGIHGGGLAAADPVAGAAALLANGLAFGPVVDGFLIPHSTAEAVRAGLGSDVPLLLGTTDHEFNMMMAGAGAVLPPAADAASLALLGAGPELADCYLKDHPGLSAGQLLGQYVTDKIFRSAVLDVAEGRAGSFAPTWAYRFAWRSPSTGEATHCIDLPFFFDCLDAERTANMIGVRPPAGLASELHGAAVSFISSGQPGWQPWDTGKHPVRVFAELSHDVEDGYGDVRVFNQAARQ